MARRSGTLVLCDGDVASLVCVTHMSEALASSADSGAAARLVVIPVHAESAARSAATRRLGAFHGAEVANALPAALPDTDVLLAAGRLARDKGLAQVVWPAHAGIAGDPESIDLERAAAIANTTVLVERLLEVEDANAPSLEAPYVDLCDRQVADLAIDLGLVPGDVWWAGGASDEQLLAAERWAPAFEACGAPLRRARAADAGPRQR